MAVSRLVPLSLLLCAAACVAPTSGSQSTAGYPPQRRVYVPDLPVSQPPFEMVHASWKQRLDQPYVYFDHYGNYAETGALIPTLYREMVAQGLEADGPPFCLFYDDPGKVPLAELRSRACIPVSGPRSPTAPLAYEVLPSVTVAYAFVSGAYPDAPRAYPGIYAFMQRMNWVDAGPIREMYLVPPGSDPRPERLIAEIQIPARPGE
ncbi:MAG: GyrI-like domain-containing protein [bacterium]|nr:GyrI-like domain-containing protein [bacterium]